MIDVLGILEELGIAWKDAGPDNVRIKCLNPNHDEKIPSMFIHKTEGVYHCFGCFVENTLIITNKGIKNIQDVKIGDKVLTHTGEYKEVINTINKIYNEDLVQIGIENNKNNIITTTQDHKFFVYKSENVFTGRFKKEDLRKRTEKLKIIGNFEEIESKNIKKGDWVFTPKIQGINLNPIFNLDIKKYTNNYGKHPKEIPSIINITEDLAWLIGLYIAEGSYNRGLVFDINNTTKLYLKNKVLDICKKIFNIEGTFYERKDRSKCLSIFIPNVILGRWFKDICGNGAANKKIPNEILHNSKNILESFLNGYYSGDGTQNISYNRKSVTTISVTLINQLKCLLENSLGIPVSLIKKEAYIDKNGVNHKISYTLNWNEFAVRLVNKIVCDNKILYRVESTNIIENKNIIVYDLTILDNSSYIANGIAVHNCGSKGTLLNLFNIKGFSRVETISFIRKFNQGGKTAEEVYKSLENFIVERTSTGLIERTDIILPEYTPIVSNYYLETLRGITKEEIEYWKMGVINNHPNRNWIIIPIYQDGILRNYFMRDPFGKGKGYGRYDRSDIVFGIDDTDPNKPLYITEGIFDMIFVRRTGVQAVAALSNTLKDDLTKKYQIDRLRKYKTIRIVPDSDEMGATLVKAIKPLIHTSDVKVCLLPLDKKDAAECSLEELQETIKMEVDLNYFLLQFELKRRQKHGNDSGHIKQHFKSRI